MGAFPAPTKTYHSSSYDAIDPSRPSLSQQGKNVVVTGAGSGIGREIAISFAKAKVANIALIGRTVQTLDQTKDLISSAYPQTKTHVFAADIMDASTLNKAFASFAETVNGPIHTLVANAGFLPSLGKLTETSEELFTKALLLNTTGTFNTVCAFMPHIPRDVDENGYRARVIHTSTAAVQANIPHNAPYSIAKTSAAKLIEMFAAENPDIWFCNFHPGIVVTAMDDITAAYGMVLEPKDDISLPANWTVWAASNESAFLPSGRFFWAHWDVTELKEIFESARNGGAEDGIAVMGGSLRLSQRYTLSLAGWP